MKRWWHQSIARLRRGTRPPLNVVYHEDYRLPLTSLQARTGMEPRRADHALWSLSATGALLPGHYFEAPLASVTDLLRVHSGALVESLGDPNVLAGIFGVEAWDVAVDGVLDTIRRAVGGTTWATRLTLDGRGPVLNLLGGFHHAGPDIAAGFCPVNDLAIAVAVARAEGFSGSIVVLDLDAHPPDGTAACLLPDPTVWIGSLSGSDWGPLPADVDETVLPKGCGDREYMAALDALLERAPRADLVFVVAGGDVVADDPIGALGLTEAGVVDRDRRVVQWVGSTPQVWVPGGGYGSGSWRRLASTGLSLAFWRPPRLSPSVDPLALRFAAISRSLAPADLGSDEGPWITAEDLPGLFGAPPQARRFLGHYTAGGILLALGRYGLVEHLARLGYVDLVVDFDQVSSGERLRVLARQAEVDDDARHLVLEVVVEATTPASLEMELPDEPPEARVLLVHWLNLRHPLAAFRQGRAPLPGQDVPGLGLAREAGELLERMAVRLECVALLVRPAWFHVAWSARRNLRFLRPETHGRFLALADALSELPLTEATHAVADGRVELDGRAYAWDPGWMVSWTSPDRDWPDADADRIAEARATASFRVRDPTDPGTPT